tara:strand:+ start:1951 stop:2202 length:252 start_codon:yes stop_codon:yes gene_type:complete
MELFQEHNRKLPSNTISTSNRIETQFIDNVYIYNSKLQIPYPPQIGLKLDNRESITVIPELQIPYPPQIGLKHIIWTISFLFM